MPRWRFNVGFSTYFTENNIHVDSIFQIMIRWFCPKVPGVTTWNQVTKQETRVEGYTNVRKTDALGRVYVVHANSEYFHLSIRLHVVKGPTSFISLRTFQGITYEKFQGFCKAMYLLEGDTHWESTLYEDILCCSAKSIIYLFVKLLAHIFFGKIITKTWLKIYWIADVYNCCQIIYISIKISWWRFIWIE